MRYLQGTVFCLLSVACAAEVPAEPVELDFADGVYAEINTDEGARFRAFCGSIAVCAGDAVRLLEQFVGADHDDYKCHSTDKVSRCHRNGQPHAFVKDCTAMAGKLEWDCTFGIAGAGGDVEYGTVRLHTPSFRFAFWDGAVGIANASEHSFDYIGSDRAAALPITR